MALRVNTRVIPTETNNSDKYGRSSSSRCYLNVHLFIVSTLKNARGAMNVGPIDDNDTSRLAAREASFLPITTPPLPLAPVVCANPRPATNPAPTPFIALVKFSSETQDGRHTTRIAHRESAQEHRCPDIAWRRVRRRRVYVGQPRAENGARSLLVMRVRASGEKPVYL